MDIDKILAALAHRLQVSIQEIRKAFQLDPFAFVINILPIAASGTGQGEFITTADAGFAIIKSCVTISASPGDTFISNISDTPRFVPITLTLSDSGSGRDFSNAPISLGSYFGDAKEPFMWATPKIVDSNSTIQLRANNLVATAFNLRFVFHGYKIFGDVNRFRNR